MKFIAVYHCHFKGDLNTERSEAFQWYCVSVSVLRPQTVAALIGSACHVRCYARAITHMVGVFQQASYFCPLNYDKVFPVFELINLCSVIKFIMKSTF